MPGTFEETAGAKIVTTLEGMFGKYLALDAGLSLVLALWTLATHLFDCFDTFPYIAVTSPTKRCGKTRLAEVIELLAAKARRTVGATQAALFRRIQEETPTLIIDEAEALRARSDRSDALLEILNAGYRRGQFVTRCERGDGQNFELRDFNTYCPKVLVLIGKLPDTLADRCIPIPMRRRKQGERVERFFFERARKEVRHFQKHITQWTEANRKRVKRRYRGRDLDFLEDREAELWLPLFSVCAVAAPERLEHLKAIAIGISRSKQADEPAELGLLLLRDTREVFNRAGEDRLPTARLIAELNTIEESPWANWSRGRGLDPRSLARLCRPFRVEPHNLRLENDQIVKGYERADFMEAWASYLPAETTATPLQGA